MNPVVLLSGKTLCIRRLKQADLQQSYYQVMSLLSSVDRTILRTRDMLDRLENEYIYFVVEDLNTQMIVGTGTIIITNTSTQISQVGYIENIMIRRDYQNIGLGDIVLQRLRHYCMTVKKCVRLTVNCDSNI
tara:strand:+ start:329 stop:724 length:396 start_codon:yes stop_codon:yes gene_type:complete